MVACVTIPISRYVSCSGVLAVPVGVVFLGVIHMAEHCLPHAPLPYILGFSAFWCSGHLEMIVAGIEPTLCREQRFAPFLLHKPVCMAWSHLARANLYTAQSFPAIQTQKTPARSCRGRSTGKGVFKGLCLGPSKQKPSLGFYSRHDVFEYKFYTHFQCLKYTFARILTNICNVLQSMSLYVCFTS